ncbi:MAG: HAMP domain-containing histidine kinase [Bacteroidetes bacterium]|nr:HAMP domain-containing histidine kinase [Bacteroidota bacterium]
MKLVTKNTLLYLAITLVVFLAGGNIFYFRLKKIIREEATEELYRKKEQVIAYIEKNQQLPSAFDETMALRPAAAEIREELKDTVFYAEAEEEYLPFTQLTFGSSLGSQHYKITLAKSLFEEDDLIETITTSFIIIASALIIILLLLNIIISKKLFRPFFKTLKLINHYDIETHPDVVFDKCGTAEFDQLNEALGKMTARISADFNNLKAFAENASHELQTPLAIIKTKSELLLQQEGLTEEQARQITDIGQTAMRAAKLNQTLLLLSKIENNQYAFKEKIDFAAIVKQKINLYDELFGMKDIVVTTFIQEATVHLHPELGDIVVSNLLSNAIKYTPSFGTVEIQLDSKKLIVSNTGSPLTADSSKLFNRFYKENPSSDSTGLGLALVKQIAILNSQSVSYKYQSGTHVFIYSF